MDKENPVDSELVNECQKAIYDLFPILLHTGRNHFRKRFAQGMHLRPAQFQIIRAIAHGRSTVGDIAEACRISPPAVSRQIDGLVEMGIISRQRDPENRRKIILTLTEKGCKKHRHLNTETYKWIAPHLEKLNEDELKTVLQGLKYLRQAFDLEQPQPEQVNHPDIIQE